MDEPDCTKSHLFLTLEDFWLWFMDDLQRAVLNCIKPLLVLHIFVRLMIKSTLCETSEMPECALTTTSERLNVI